MPLALKYIRNFFSVFLLVILFIFVWMPSGIAASSAFTGYITKDGVRMRAEPTVDSKRMETLNRGDKVKVLKQETNAKKEKWYKVTFEDLTGYVRSDLVSKKVIRVRGTEPDLMDSIELTEHNEKEYLKPILVIFPENKRFPVYSGPGTDYLRGNEIAVVSTNGKIQVFGYENDWVLIQYSIGYQRLRIGYIEARHLPEKYLNSSGHVNPDMIRELNNEYWWSKVTEDTFLTDDPLLSQANLIDLEDGTSVMVLGYLENWVYVEYIKRISNSERIKVRGFLRKSQLEDMS